MAGYSKRSLAEKLGIKADMKVTVVHPPTGYLDGLGLPPTVKILKTLGPGRDFVQAFYDRASGLERELPKLKRSLAMDGMLWLSWPKKASGVPTDVSDGVVRRLGLAVRLVDVKVCAVNDVWSGLKFVYRLKDRRS